MPMPTEQDWFETHTAHTAPSGSRTSMEGVAKRLGGLPEAVARLAESPELLNGFLRLSASFETTTLDPLARETVVMTVATRNACHVCVEMHTTRLHQLGAAAELTEALRTGTRLPDVRLDAVREFTLRVLETAGGVDDATLSAFFAHGYSRRNALEVVLGIGTYTLSTLANRLVRAGGRQLPVG